MLAPLAAVTLNVCAVDATPVKFAVIVPALKPPEESRATIVETVFKFVASVAIVILVFPAWLAVKVPEPVICVPLVIVKIPSFTVG